MVLGSHGKQQYWSGWTSHLHQSNTRGIISNCVMKTKPLDKDHKIQRFTPRNPKSTYSQANKERLKWLLENKMIHPKFEEKTRRILSEPFIFPNDIIDKLKEDETVWKNYQPFSEAYKRIRIAYIEAARKRPEEFEKRLNNFISKTKDNKTIAGFGGIEKYY